jgi:hypothetical protein
VSRDGDSGSWSQSSAATCDRDFGIAANWFRVSRTEGASTRSELGLAGFVTVGGYEIFARMPRVSIQQSTGGAIFDDYPFVTSTDSTFYGSLALGVKKQLGTPRGPASGAFAIRASVLVPTEHDITRPAVTVSLVGQHRFGIVDISSTGGLVGRFGDDTTALASGVRWSGGVLLHLGSDFAFFSETAGELLLSHHAEVGSRRATISNPGDVTFGVSAAMSTGVQVKGGLLVSTTASSAEGLGHYHGFVQVEFSRPK